MVHVPAKFQENTSMRFWVTVWKLNVTDGQTDGRTGDIAISPVPGPTARRETIMIIFWWLIIITFFVTSAWVPWSQSSSITLGSWGGEWLDGAGICLLCTMFLLTGMNGVGGAGCIHGGTCDLSFASSKVFSSTRRGWTSYSWQFKET